MSSNTQPQAQPPTPPSPERRRSKSFFGKPRFPSTRQPSTTAISPPLSPQHNKNDTPDTHGHGHTRHSSEPAGPSSASSQPQPFPPTPPSPALDNPSPPQTQRRRSGQFQRRISSIFRRSSSAKLAKELAQADSHGHVARGPSDGSTAGSGPAAEGGPGGTLRQKASKEAGTQAGGLSDSEEATERAQGHPALGGGEESAGAEAAGKGKGPAEPPASYFDVAPSSDRDTIGGDLGAGGIAAPDEYSDGNSIQRTPSQGRSMAEPSPAPVIRPDLERKRTNSSSRSVNHPYPTPRPSSSSLGHPASPARSNSARSPLQFPSVTSPPPPQLAVPSSPPSGTIPIPSSSTSPPTTSPGPVGFPSSPSSTHDPTSPRHLSPAEQTLRKRLYSDTSLRSLSMSQSPRATQTEGTVDTALGRQRKTSTSSLASVAGEAASGARRPNKLRKKNPNRQRSSSLTSGPPELEEIRNRERSSTNGSIGSSADSLARPRTPPVEAASPEDELASPLPIAKREHKRSRPRHPSAYISPTEPTIGSTATVWGEGSFDEQEERRETEHEAPPALPDTREEVQEEAKEEAPMFAEPEEEQQEFVNDVREQEIREEEEPPEMMAPLSPIEEMITPGSSVQNSIADLAPGGLGITSGDDDADTIAHHDLIIDPNDTAPPLLADDPSVPTDHPVQTGHVADVVPIPIDSQSSAPPTATLNGSFPAPADVGTPVTTDFEDAMSSLSRSSKPALEELLVIPDGAPAYVEHPKGTNGIIGVSDGTSTHASTVVAGDGWTPLPDPVTTSRTPEPHSLPLPPSSPTLSTATSAPAMAHPRSALPAPIRLPLFRQPIRIHVNRTAHRIGLIFFVVTPAFPMTRVSDFAATLLCIPFLPFRICWSVGEAVPGFGRTMRDLRRAVLRGGVRPHLRERTSLLAGALRTNYVEGAPTSAGMERRDSGEEEHEVGASNEDLEMEDRDAPILRDTELAREREWQPPTSFLGKAVDVVVGVVLRVVGWSGATSAVRRARSWSQGQ